MSGAWWDELYMTSCDDPEIIDWDGFCSSPDEVVPGCSVMDEVEWIETSSGNWRRHHNCLECTAELNVNGEIIEHRFPPV